MANRTLISHPAAERIAEMKLLWVLLTVAVTAAELLDRGYLPPLSASGGSPSYTDVPLDLPKSEIAIGINRVPSKVADFEESVSKALIDDNVVNIPTESLYQDFTQSTTFPVASSHSTTIAGYYFDPYKLTQAFDEYATGGDISKSFPAISIPAENTPQLIRDDNKYPSVTVDDKHRPADLVYKGITDTINSDPSKLSSIVNKDLLDPNNYYSSLVNPGTLKTSVIGQKLGTIPNSHSIPNYYSDHNNNRPTITFDSLMPFQASSITPITIHEESKLTNYIGTETRPERIQSQYDRVAVIINYEQTRTPESYAYSYDTSNGIHADEGGSATNGVRAKGSYSYIGDDGKLYHVEYTADENGFQPKGVHLPTSPPIPDAILRVIEQATKNKESGVYDDGSYNEEKYGYEKYKGVNPSTGYFNVHTGDLEVQNGFDNLEEIHNNSLEQISSQHNNILLHSLQTDSTQKFDDFIESKAHNTPNFNVNNEALKYHYFPEKTKQYNNTVPEPFLTPYVSRNNDDQESDESDEMTFENQYSTNNKDTSSNSDSTRGEDELNNNSIKTDLGMQYLKLVLGKVPEQQLHFENRQLSNDNLIPSYETGQYYNEVLSLKQNDANQPLITTEANIQYTSRLVPIGFPSSSITSQTLDINASTPGKIESLSQIYSNEAKAYPGVYESQTTTEKIIGEDFSGAGQRQSFDSVTGYHY